MAGLSHWMHWSLQGSFAGHKGLSLMTFRDGGGSKGWGLVGVTRALPQEGTDTLVGYLTVAAIKRARTLPTLWLFCIAM